MCRRHTRSSAMDPDGEPVKWAQRVSDMSGGRDG